MKATVLKDKCCGYGICAEICPSIFKVDDQGFAYVEDSEVSDDLVEAAQEASESCPESAIVVE
ncbi:MAG: ferredoxin [Frankiaceae bacterium]|nr:ferredoxin [Frankiaceae bacterium]